MRQQPVNTRAVASFEQTTYKTNGRGDRTAVPGILMIVHSYIGERSPQYASFNSESSLSDSKKKIQQVI